MLFYIDGKQFLGGSEKFDLVILDIDLPDIDGITISKTDCLKNTIHYISYINGG